jgi:hypothetical protein
LRRDGPSKAPIDQGNATAIVDYLAETKGAK